MPTPAHDEDVAATTSVLALQINVFGAKCLDCDTHWDMGQLMQALVDNAALQSRVAELGKDSSQLCTNYRELSVVRGGPHCYNCVKRNGGPRLARPSSECKNFHPRPQAAGEPGETEKAE